MSPTGRHNYVNNRILCFFVRQFSLIWNVLTSFIYGFIRIGRQRFTVMLIPHSEKKVFNFHISVFSLVFFGLILSGVIISFFLFSTQFSGLSRMLTAKSASLETSQENIDLVREEVAELRRVSRAFERSLHQALGAFGVEAEANSQNMLGGDLVYFFDIEKQDSSNLQELSDLKNLQSFLNDSGKSLEMVSDLIDAHGSLLVELPTLWPVENGLGRITNYFGPEMHPFTQQWYLHKGIDIAYRRGKPIIASANGKVVERKYDAMGFGHYLIIRHAYGFLTKYAHLDSIYVEEGDVVTQGQRIGTMGNTGLSTGPHLHFEVRIGSQVVDPLRFLNVQVGMR